MRAKEIYPDIVAKELLVSGKVLEGRVIIQRARRARLPLEQSNRGVYYRLGTLSSTAVITVPNSVKTEDIWDRLVQTSQEIGAKLALTRPTYKWQVTLSPDYRRLFVTKKRAERFAALPWLQKNYQVKVEEVK